MSHRPTEWRGLVFALVATLAIRLLAWSPWASASGERVLYTPTIPTPTPSVSATVIESPEPTSTQMPSSPLPEPSDTPETISETPTDPAATASAQATATAQPTTTGPAPTEVPSPTLRVDTPTPPPATGPSPGPQPTGTGTAPRLMTSLPSPSATLDTLAGPGSPTQVPSEPSPALEPGAGGLSGRKTSLSWLWIVGGLILIAAGTAVLLGHRQR